MSPVAPVISPGGAINGGTLRTGTRHPRCSERTPEPTHPPGARKVPLWQEAEGGPQPGCHSCSAHASPNPHAPRQVQRHGGGSGAQSQQEPRCVSCAGEEPPASCDRLRPAFTLSPSSSVATPVQGAPGRQGPGGAKGCAAPSNAHLCIQPSGGWGQEEGERLRKAPH